MNIRHKQIINYIKNNQGCTSLDISKILHIQEASVRRYLRELKASNLVSVDLLSNGERGRPFEIFFINSGE